MAAEALGVAAPLVWLGMVLGISFLETPLKFQAPGITIPLGLGIGRLVFRALNAVEVLLVVITTVALLASSPGVAAWVLVIVLWVLLGVQVVVVRRSLDRRTAQVIAGADLPRSRQHLAYVGLEVVKAGALIVLAAVLLARFG